MVDKPQGFCNFMSRLPEFDLQCEFSETRNRDGNQKLCRDNKN